ncbi:MAG TPA: hypothetical protein VKA84_12705, partial [Gemmatimonadaceae bacterium]|nr:hypothetical protein [Gemmatimonadaceae bacterium]
MTSPAPTPLPSLSLLMSMLLLMLGAPACGTRADGATGQGDAGGDAAVRVEDALLRDRFTPGRLARQTAWQPCVVVNGAAAIPRSRCGPPLTPGTDAFERQAKVAADARLWLRSDSSPEALRARAMLELRWRDATPAGVDRAVAALERARRQAPRDPGLLNDLAVAYLALGERDQQLRAMLQALDAVGRALDLDSTLAAARYNRALILERLYLEATAREAWTRYLAAERRPDWRAEAESHLRRLRERDAVVPWGDAPDSSLARGDDAAARAELAARVRRSPQDARDHGFRLLRDWGRAVRDGDGARAARRLAAARRVARALDDAGADQSLALALAAIDAHAGDPRRTRALADAHVAFAEGVALAQHAAYDDAARTLARSEGAFRAAGSPAARWAAFSRAGLAEINLGRGRYAAADRRLARVAAEASPAEPALRGKAVWALGVSQLRRGAYENANRLYREAAPYLERAGEPENQGAIAYLLAEGLNLAGQVAAGRAEALRGLRLLAPFRRSNFLNNHLTTVAAYARADGLSFAALAVMDEVLGVARATGRPQVLAWAYRARARDLIALGRPEAARAALDTALRWADRIAPGPGRDRVRADVLLVIGRLTRDRDPRAALEILSRAAGAYRELDADGHLAAALYQAALAAGDAGDAAGARRRLAGAIAAIERQRESFETADARATLYETVEDVFDRMTEVELDGGRADSAFAYFERGRVAIRPPASAAPATTTLAATQAVLPEGTLLVEYALLRDRVVVWSATRQGRRQQVVPVSRDSVAALVDRFIREIREGRAA